MQKESHPTSIVLKIWIAAIFLNTLFGTAVITNVFTTDASTVGIVALLGLTYGILLTLPLAGILFVLMRLYVRMDMHGRKLFLLMLASGQFLTVAFVTLFFLLAGTFLLPVWSILVVALLSASIGICLEYEAIIHLNKKQTNTWN